MNFYQPTVEKDDIINEKIAQSGRSMMFLTADWCGDCKAIKPFVQDFRDTVESKDIKWFDAARDENIEVAKAQGLMGIPSFVLFEDGQQVKHFGNGERLNPKEVAAWVAAL